MKSENNHVYLVSVKVLISGVELRSRKSHKVVILALNEIYNPEVYYVIVGKGTLKGNLDKTGRLWLLGHHTKISY